MRTPRISIAWLMGLVVVAGVGFAALGSPTTLWASAIFSLALLAVLIATLGAAALRGRDRLVCGGFAFFAGAYLVMAFGVWHDANGLSAPSLLPRAALDKLRDWQTPALEAKGAALVDSDPNGYPVLPAAAPFAPDLAFPVMSGPSVLPSADAPTLPPPSEPTLGDPPTDEIPALGPVPVSPPNGPVIPAPAPPVVAVPPLAPSAAPFLDWLDHRRIGNSLAAIALGYLGALVAMILWKRRLRDESAHAAPIAAEPAEPIP